MRTWITAAALGAAVLGGFAGAGVQAQAPTAPAAPAPAPTNAADQDGDGIVTREEAAADADRRFAAMDANHDGKLTVDERRSWRAQHRSPPRMRERRDADQSQAQFRDRALRRFDRIDTNHDGRIDAREREAMMLMMRARHVGHARGVAPVEGDVDPAPAG